MNPENSEENIQMENDTNIANRNSLMNIDGNTEVIDKTFQAQNNNDVEFLDSQIETHDEDLPL